MLVYHKEYREFLEKLRAAGVVHIQQSSADTSEVPEIKEIQSEYTGYLRLLHNLEKLAPESKEIAASCDGAREIVARAEELYSTLDTLKQALQTAEKDFAQMKVWGDFDISLLDKLAAEGYVLNFFQTAVKSFDTEWADKYNAIIIKQNGSRIYFVTVTDGTVPEIDAEHVILPDSRLDDIYTEVERLQVEINLATEQLASLASTKLPVLRAKLNELNGKLDFSRVEYSGEKVTGDKLLLLQGWVPEENSAELRTILDESGAFYELRPIVRGEQFPVKLKNNLFTRMYEVLTKMYGMPGGTDFDPTPIVAPFFSLFFAFCMGDAGYGLILILLGFILKKKLSKDMAGMMNLVITLGIFTTVLGAFLGTFFGMSLIESDIPQRFKDFIIAGNVELFGSTYDKQMILALGIGVVHISIAMTVKAINSTIFYGFKNSLSQWGWWLVVVGGVVVGTLSFLSIIPAQLSQWVFIAIAGVGALGIYLFNDLKRNVLVNIGAGLWDTYNMASGLMGDILSYVRLFALGLAGGMLGQTFNSLALMVVDGKEGVWAVLGWIGFGLIIIFGHTLNIAMSCLSAFVHPLRLTFVEYFKNAGYEGNGVEYKPFKKEV